VAALALLVLLAIVAALVRRAPRGSRAREDLLVAGRVTLSRDCGLALVHVRGEHVLLGYGRDGVRVLVRQGRERAP
jgi:hypothetical protein